MSTFDSYNHAGSGDMFTVVNLPEDFSYDFVADFRESYSGRGLRTMVDAHHYLGKVASINCGKRELVRKELNVITFDEDLLLDGEVAGVQILGLEDRDETGVVMGIGSYYHLVLKDVVIVKYDDSLTGDPSEEIMVPILLPNEVHLYG